MYIPRLYYSVNFMTMYLENPHISQIYYYDTINQVHYNHDNLSIRNDVYKLIIIKVYNIATSLSHDYLSTTPLLHESTHFLNPCRFK